MDKHFRKEVPMVVFKKPWCYTVWSFIPKICTESVHLPAVRPTFRIYNHKKRTFPVKLNSANELATIAICRGEFKRHPLPNKAVSFRRKSIDSRMLRLYAFSCRGNVLTTEQAEPIYRSFLPPCTFSIQIYL